MGGYDGDSAYTALRVEPLDEKLRVLNRKYIKTIGYDSNNLFTTNWDESDMNKINYMISMKHFTKLNMVCLVPIRTRGLHI